MISAYITESQYMTVMYQKIKGQGKLILQDLFLIATRA